MKNFLIICSMLANVFAFADVDVHPGEQHVQTVRGQGVTYINVHKDSNCNEHAEVEFISNGGTCYVGSLSTKFSNNLTKNTGVEATSAEKWSATSMIGDSTAAVMVSFACGLDSNIQESGIPLTMRLSACGKSSILKLKTDKPIKSTLVLILKTVESNQ